MLRLFFLRRNGCGRKQGRILARSPTNHYKRYSGLAKARWPYRSLQLWSGSRSDNIAPTAISAMLQPVATLKACA